MHVCVSCGGFWAGNSFPYLTAVLGEADPFELGIMDEIYRPVRGVVEYGKQRLEVMVTVDHDFVF